MVIFISITNKKGANDNIGLAASAHTLFPIADGRSNLLCTKLFNNNNAAQDWETVVAHAAPAMPRPNTGTISRSPQKFTTAAKTTCDAM